MENENTVVEFKKTEEGNSVLSIRDKNNPEMWAKFIISKEMIEKMKKEIKETS